LVDEVASGWQNYVRFMTGAEAVFFDFVSFL